MKSVSVVFSVPLVILIGLICGSDSEEQCSWKPDGTQVCENEETHNVWTEEHPTDEGSSQDEVDAFMDKNTKGIKRLEAELIVNHAKQIKPDDQPIQIVKKALDSFSTVDTNDDGKLSEDEIEVFLEPRKINNKENILEEYSENVITILRYFDMLGKLQQEYHDLLSPFQKLDFLASVEIKKVIHGSVKMFLENDLDGSNSLNKEELLKSMDRTENKRAKMMTLEQKEAIFMTVDADRDGEVTYPEFQVILPPKPKDVSQNLKELFKHADLDMDGFLSKDEFEVHMKTMTLRMKTPTPKSSEVNEAFKKLDKDQDGQVSEKEMTGISEELEQLQEEKSAQAFNEMDADGDGQLSRDEIAIIAKTMAERSGQIIETDMLISMLDTNSDGIIQLEEVHAMVKRMSPTGQ